MNILLGLLLSAASVALGSNVVQLADRNFTHDTQIGEGMTTGPWFIKFYAPWCGHCQRLAPVWEALADELVKEQINVAEIDCVSNKKICARFDVPGYPTLIYFRDNKMYKYRGKRDQATLSEFVRYNYKSAEHLDVPMPLTSWGHTQIALQAIAADLEQIWESKKAAGATLIVVGASVGIPIGGIASFYFARKVLSPQARQQATAATSKKKH